MGLVFEELIHKFAEISNETAGEHFTPREVFRLMVNLLFIEDDNILAKPGVVRTIYDPTAGTGGMLSVAGEYLEEHNPQASLVMFGQELNPESYAICKADMLIKGQDVANIVFGNTFMFYNTGISTYVWILSNRKPEHRKGTVQLIDASNYWQKMRKSLGSKRKELSDEHITEITRLFGQCIEANDGKKPISKIFKNSDFGYRTITVERPLKGDNGKPILGEKGKLKGKPQPDSSLRDTENVPLNEDVATYFKREVLPHAPDAWIDPDKTKVGYEIPFNRHFYVFEPPRELAEIDADLKQCTDRILTMIEGLTA
jgi:type I restriction-modification system DNA methylase subunit